VCTQVCVCALRPVSPLRSVYIRCMYAHCMYVHCVCVYCVYVHTGLQRASRRRGGGCRQSERGRCAPRAAALPSFPQREWWGLGLVWSGMPARHDQCTCAYAMPARHDQCACAQRKPRHPSHVPRCTRCLSMLVAGTKHMNV